MSEIQIAIAAVVYLFGIIVRLETILFSFSHLGKP